MIIPNDSSNPYSWRFTNNLKKLSLHSGTVAGCHSISNKCFGIMYGSNVWSREEYRCFCELLPTSLKPAFNTGLLGSLCLSDTTPSHEEKTNHTKQFTDSGRKISSSRTAWATQAEAVSTTKVRFERCSRSVMHSCRTCFLLYSILPKLQLGKLGVKGRKLTNYRIQWKWLKLI